MANWLEKVFRRNEEIDWMFDLDLLEKSSDRIYLKQLAIQICVNHIADTISQSNFKINDDEKLSKHIEYLLNVRPNRNQNASQFWQQVIYRLINDNEVLIIQTDSEELVIASDFIKEDAALYDSIFKEVQVGDDFTFKRNFTMSDVIYLEYSNGQMKQIIDGLFNDYGDMFSRLVKYQLHAHQIRATFQLGALGKKDATTKDKFQSFVDKLTDSFNKNDVAIVPLQDGHEYKEHGNTAAGKSVDEVNKVLNGFIDKVAMALRIPANLLNGEMADTKEASRNYMKFCINPLLKQISDEFTSKLFEREDIESKDYGLEIRPLSLENLFDRAEAIDKLISSSAYTPNEIRIKAGDKPSEDPKMNEHIRTKNYESVESSDEERATQNE